jgi:hypothetical protein
MACTPHHTHTHTHTHARAHARRRAANSVFKSREVLTSKSGLRSARRCMINTTHTHTHTHTRTHAHTHAYTLGGCATSSSSAASTLRPSMDGVRELTMGLSRDCVDEHSTHTHTHVCTIHAHKHTHRNIQRHSYGTSQGRVRGENGGGASILFNNSAGLWLWCPATHVFARKVAPLLQMHADLGRAMRDIRTYITTLSQRNHATRT